MSNDYYANRGHVALNCWTCDQMRCKCDVAQMRATKRGAKQKWRREIDQVAFEERAR